MTFSKAYYIFFSLIKLFVILLSSHVFAYEQADTTQPHNSPVLFSQIHTTLQTKLGGSPKTGQNSFPDTLTSKFKSQYIPQTSNFGGQSNPHSQDTYETSKFGDPSSIHASKFRDLVGPDGGTTSREIQNPNSGGREIQDRNLGPQNGYPNSSLYSPHPDPDPYPNPKPDLNKPDVPDPRTPDPSPYPDPYPDADPRI